MENSIKQKIINIALRSFMTGIAIGIGATVFLSCENKMAGAFLFGTGLFIILNFGFYLYTGKVGYIVERKPSYIAEVALIWLGNFAGTFMFARLVLCTRISGIAEKAAAMCSVKAADTPASLLVLSFFCGILMFIAADGFSKIENPVGKIMAVFLPVMAFILSGFEHSIADMFYFSVSGTWTARTFLCLIIMTLGNALGGMLVPLAKKGFSE
ncbi:formate/nitrite transporter family protein [Treponema sp.]|uniref:formate/nitrite transporter family protein n=1 Tax=Treponema sp. TaxID=166 RepID=UPI003EFE81FF